MTKTMIDFSFHQDEPLALAIGFFDGLHLGHQMLLKEIHKHNLLTPSILTFSRDFKSEVLKKNEELLLTEEEKDTLLLKMGIQKEFVLPFTEEIMKESPAHFLQLLKQMNAQVIVVGSDFRFGKDALGDVSFLLHHAGDMKIIPLDLLCLTGEKISSSHIKTLLKEHKLPQANACLSYPFFITNPVIHGFENGRKIGFPTANLSYPREKVKLPSGVYKTVVEIDAQSYLGMTNIGNHPTISALSEDIIETHILDFDSDIYGKEIKVSFIDYLRPQQKFASLETLKLQLKQDLEKIKH